MILLLALVLLIACSTRGQLTPINYQPVIATSPMEGQITSSTFVLEQPRCIFNQTSTPPDEIWLMVAYSDAVSSIKNPDSLQSRPSYQQFTTNRHYMTMGTSLLNYPCASNLGQITVLRVGNETVCVLDTSRPDCNGPLPGPGPYSVKFLAINPQGGVTAETKWSAEITLKTGKNIADIETWPRRRSAGMIVITTLLSILLAVLLACFIAALIYGCSDLSESAEIMGKEPVTVKRYNTHHVYDQPPYKQ
uniref:Uncharacterized protein n=1 Tax=Pelusios castaneus TaxID=367368 RepID=A0A8C8S8J6_9SAUR